MWNPSQAEVAEIQMLKRAHPAIERHMNNLLDHLGVATRKVAFYEGIASPETIEKAAAAGLAGFTAMEKATFLAKAATAQQRVPMDDRLAEVAAPAEGGTLAKRAPGAMSAGFMGGTGLAKGVTARDVVAMVRHAQPTLPAGHCGHNR